MSLFGTLSRPQTFSAASRTIAAYSLMARDWIQQPSTRHPHSNTKPTRAAGGHKTRRAANVRTKCLEDVFIHSLVAAGSCRQHDSAYTFPITHTATKRHWRDQPLRQRSTKRQFSTTARRSETAAVTVAEDEEEEPEITKDEYKDMVNTYGMPSDLWDRPAITGPRTKQPPLAPRLVIPPEKEDKPPYEPRRVLDPEDAEHERNLLRFERLVGGPRGKVSLAHLWRAYHKLRSPRPRYLSEKTIRTFFNQLTWTEFKHTPGAKERYLALLEECVGEQVQLTAIEWSTAINYAGRALDHGTSADVKQAIELWLRMEESGIEATHTTFNVLFYVAVKAGRFALADTIYNELRARDLELDRYFRASMIYYGGLRGDGDAVRKAFNDMVNANEIIDVAIMNCVILSMIRAGEPEAAENIFMKMKNLHETKFGTKGPNDWRAQKRLAKLLNKTGRILRKEQQRHEASFFGAQYSGDDKRERIQRISPIAPNARTYRLLIRHHARVSGDMSRMRELLDESKAQGFHTHGSVYTNIFYGFSVHGGHVDTAWEPNLLESFWQEFLEASSKPNAGYWLSSLSGSIDVPNNDLLNKDAEYAASTGLDGVEDAEQQEDVVDEEDRAPYFTNGLAICTIQAFYKCLGRKRMLEVWGEIKARWKDCGPDQRELVESIIEDIIRLDL